MRLTGCILIVVVKAAPYVTEQHIRGNGLPDDLEETLKLYACLLVSRWKPEVMR